MSRQTLLLLSLPRRMFGVGFKKDFMDILVLKSASPAGFTPHPKNSSWMSKNHLLLLKINNLAQNPFALTWPELPLAPCCCFHSCALAQSPGMAANPWGSAALGSHPWHPGLEWELGAPRFGVGGKFWQLPSGPKGQEHPGDASRTRSSLDRPTLSSPKPAPSYFLKINIPLLPKGKAGSHCSPGPADDVIFGFFPHKPGSLKYQCSTTQVTQPHWKFFPIFRATTHLVASQSQQLCLNTHKSQAWNWNWAHPDPWSKIWVGVG